MVMNATDSSGSLRPYDRDANWQLDVVRSFFVMILHGFIA